MSTYCSFHFPVIDCSEQDVAKMIVAISSNVCVGVSLMLLVWTNFFKIDDTLSCSHADTTLFMIRHFLLPLSILIAKHKWHKRLCKWKFSCSFCRLFLPPFRRTKSWSVKVAVHMLTIVIAAGGYRNVRIRLNTWRSAKRSGWKKSRVVIAITLRERLYQWSHPLRVNVPA